MSYLSPVDGVVYPSCIKTTDENKHLPPWARMDPITDSELEEIMAKNSEDARKRQANFQEQVRLHPERYPTYDVVTYEGSRVEDLDLYRKGGWHPLDINDRLDSGRYEIILKVNHGSFSVIWLAIDHEGSHKNRYVVIKVNAASFDESSREVKIIDQLHNTLNPEDRGKRRILSFHRSFIETGPNGSHFCSVSEPMQSSLAGATLEEEIFDLPVARAIIAQMIVGLKALHSCDVAHGDIHPGNLVFKSEPLHHLTVKEVYDKIEEPLRFEMHRMDKEPLGPEAPKFVSDAVGFDKLARNITLKDSELVFIDFGESWDATGENVKEFLNSPLVFRAPEGEWDPSTIGLPSDIWSLACCMWNVLFSRCLFEARGEDYYTVTRHQMNMIGALPKKWQKDWDKMQNKWDEVRREEGEHDEDSNESEFAGDEVGPDTAPVSPDNLSGHYDSHVDGVNAEDAIQATNRESEDLPARQAKADEPVSEPLLLRNIHTGLQARNDGEEAMSAEEEKALGQMLQSMLVFDPSKRATAFELEKCEWMQRWGECALDDLEKVRRQSETPEDSEPPHKKRKTWRSVFNHVKKSRGDRRRRQWMGSMSHMTRRFTRSFQEGCVIQ